VRLLDLKADVETLVAGYRERTLRTALFGALGIVLLLALQLRKLRAIASMLATLVTTVVFTAWAILMIEGSLTIFNVVALLLVVGVASNYTMFFSTLSPEPGERRRASLSVLLAAASTFSAFAMLALSTSPVLAKIGTTVAIGALAGLAASMVFAPRRRKPS
jgi:predicted exporter